MASRPPPRMRSRPFCATRRALIANSGIRGRDARPKARCSAATGLRPRSEEHTSELQSLTNLVCRLLLEKKKEHGAPSLLTPKQNEHDHAFLETVTLRDVA